MMGGVGWSCGRMGLGEGVSRRGDRKAEQAFAKIIEAGKGIRAREISREEIQDLVAQNVSTELEAVMTMDPGDGIGVLLTVNRGLARTERVPAHKQKSLAQIKYVGFGIDLGGQPRFAVALVAELGDVQHVWCYV